MKFPYGTLIDTLPTEYMPRQQWPEYDTAAQVLPSMGPHAVGSGVVGVQWGWWPIMFEEYVSDSEPTIVSQGPNRIIVWQRLARRDIPTGWYQLSRKPARIEGFAQLTSDDYRSVWSESARRYTRKWETDFLNTHYRVVVVSFEEFSTAYRHSSVAKKARDFQLDILGRMLANPACAPHITLWGARHTETGALVAGLATVTSLTHKASYYQAGFICDTPDDAPAMVGLMDHWFATARGQGLTYLTFGGFWHPGLPQKIWGGFSTFKAKFGLQYIAYAPPLMRLKRGTFTR